MLCHILEKRIFKGTVQPLEARLFQTDGKDSRIGCKKGRLSPNIFLKLKKTEEGFFIFGFLTCLVGSFWF
jgi:hypothetical protein